MCITSCGYLQAIALIDGYIVQNQAAVALAS